MLTWPPVFECGTRARSHAREWRNRQTRTVQVRVPERAWGFNSPSRTNEGRLPSHIFVRGAFFAAGGLFGGLGSADNPVADCVAVDESAGAHEAACAAVHPL